MMERLYLCNSVGVAYPVSERRQRLFIYTIIRLGIYQCVSLEDDEDRQQSV